MSEEPEMPDADEAWRQDMQKEPPQKLVESQVHQSLLVLMRRVAPAEHDLAVFQRHQTVIGDGHGC